MQALWEWLIGEAGAGWIMGLLGLGATLYAWLKRERPPRIIIQEIKTTRLLDIHPSQQEKVKVYYASSQDTKTPIHNLVQKQVVIYNSGSKDILEELTLELGLSALPSDEEESPHPFLDLVFDDPISASLTYDENDTSIVSGVHIEIPYLNSYDVHKHYVLGYLISDQQIELELVDGVGKGWSARFVPSESQLKTKSRIQIGLGIAVLGSLILALLILVLEFMQHFRSPVGRAFMNPTNANLQAAIQLYEEILEGMKTKSLLARAAMSTMLPGAKATPVALIITVLSLILMTVRNTVIRLVSRLCLGLQPTSKFIQNKTT